MSTLKVTFYGGPGTGKSTTNALVFGKLKQRGLNVEMAHEYAKDLVWESRDAALQYQPYIIAKQMWRERRLEGQVEAILTDTSTLFCEIYGSEDNGVTPAFKAWVVDEYKKANRLDFFLTRDPQRAYNPNGRTQKTIQEAEVADSGIKLLLDSNDIDYEMVQVNKDDTEYIDYIVAQIENTLACQTEVEEMSGMLTDIWIGELGTIKTERMDCSKPNWSSSLFAERIADA